MLDEEELRSADLIVANALQKTHTRANYSNIPETLWARQRIARLQLFFV